MDICLHILALILPTALHNLSLNCTIFDSPSRIWVAPRRIQLTFIEITACASLFPSLSFSVSLTVYLMPHFSRDSWQHCLKFCCKFQFFHATFPTCCLSISSICREECVCVCVLAIDIFLHMATQSDSDSRRLWSKGKTAIKIANTIIWKAQWNKLKYLKLCKWTVSHTHTHTHADRIPRSHTPTPM